MRWLAIALALQTGDPREAPEPQRPSFFSSGRVVDEANVHLGVRPAVFADHGMDEDWGVGLTIQLTVDAL